MAKKAKAKQSSTQALVYDDIMSPFNSTEATQILNAMPYARYAYELWRQGKLKRVERSKPFKATATKKAPDIKAQCYEWLVYYFGKYPAPKWFRSLINKLPVTLECTTSVQIDSYLTKGVFHEAVSRDIFQGELYQPPGEELLGRSAQHRPVLHFVLALLQMSGQSPYKEGIKVMIQNAAQNVRTLFLRRNHLPPSMEELQKHIALAYYTKKELHALLTCPHHFDGDSLALAVWGLGADVSTKSYLLRFCNYAKRIRFAEFNLTAMRSIIHYFAEVQGDIDQKDKDMEERARLKAAWEQSYRDEGLDVSLFAFKWQKKKDRYINYRQDLTLEVLQDLLDYLRTCIRGDGSRLRNAMKQSLATLQDESERWHRNALRDKSMSQPANQWSALMDHSLFLTERDPQAPEKGVAYEFKELCSGKELAEEGKAQRHCVGSYVSSCKAGTTRIVSMRKVTVTFHGDDPQDYTEATAWKRALTIELARGHRGTWTAIQVRGYANRMATSAERNLVAKWENALNSVPVASAAA